MSDELTTAQILGQYQRELTKEGISHTVRDEIVRHAATVIHNDLAGVVVGPVRPTGDGQPPEPATAWKNYVAQQVSAS